MKFIRKHKLTTIIMVAFIIFVIVFYYLWNVFFIKVDKPKYGDRLSGIEAAEIRKEDITEIKSVLKENKNVKEVSLNVSGRTLDIVITVDDALSVSDAKKVAETSYTKLNEKQIDYYSIQIFVDKKDETKNNFPIIGYKQKKTKNLIWTKDRAVTTTNETK